MIKAMIVDDELHAREELATLLEETKDVEIVASCANALEAIKQFNALKPQVLFLDIQMPMINGFELLSMIDAEKMPHVVFVTAYDQYALKAFEEKTLDYLLKPFEDRDLVWKCDSRCGFWASRRAQADYYPYPAVPSLRPSLRGCDL